MTKKGNLFFSHFPSPASHMHTSKEIRRMNFIATLLQMSVETNLNNDLFLRINKTNRSSFSLEILASLTDMKPQKASGI